MDTIPTWITVTPKSGDGDGTLNISAVAHTGRSARSYGNGTSTGIKVTAGSVTKYIKVSQAAKAEFVSFAQSTYSAAYNATSITITGTSNCASLTFSLIGNSTVTAANANCQMKFSDGSIKYKSEDAKSIKFESYDSSTNIAVIKYTGSGSTQKSGTALSGDPGASAQYTFSIVLTFTANNTASTTESATLKVIGSSSTITSSTTITRNAASVFLNLGASSVDLVTAGTAKTVSIDSNGSWTVSGT